MKGFICLLHPLSAVVLALLSVAHGQGETFNLTVAEGDSFRWECDYSDVIWNVTNEGHALTVAWCYSGQCFLTNPYNERYYVGLYDKSSPEYTARRSYLIIQGISRSITKVQCYRDNNEITRTWLTAVIVRPRLIECLTPTIDSTDRENHYIIRVTCSFEVFPAGNCTIALQGLREVYQTETDLDHTLLYSTHTYRTTCVHSLYVYESKWDKETYFQVTAYPDVSSARNFSTSTLWIRLNEEVTKVMDFTLNNRSNGAMVYSDQTVVVQCIGQGDPGSTLELFQRDPYKKLHSVSLPRVLTYVFQGPPSCGASYGLGCRVGYDERYLDLNTIACSSNDNIYLMAVIIPLALAILLVAAIIFCCIRMRLRVRRQRSRGPGRQHATPQPATPPHSCPSPEEPSEPPAYHEIFSIDVPQEIQGPPDYWSLPPPYSASELPKTEVEQISLSDTPMTLRAPPETLSDTPRTLRAPPETTQTQV